MPFVVTWVGWSTCSGPGWARFIDLNWKKLQTLLYGKGLQYIVYPVPAVQPALLLSAAVSRQIPLSLARPASVMRTDPRPRRLVIQLSASPRASCSAAPDRSWPAPAPHRSGPATRRAGADAGFLHPRDVGGSALWCCFSVIRTPSAPMSAPLPSAAQTQDRLPGDFDILPGGSVIDDPNTVTPRGINHTWQCRFRAASGESPGTPGTAQRLAARHPYIPAPTPSRPATVDRRQPEQSSIWTGETNAAIRTPMNSIFQAQLPACSGAGPGPFLPPR